MDDVSELLLRAREDVEAALEVWRDLLLEVYGRDLICLYAKGSAVKPWEGPIDYVPTLSDLDLHLETTFADGLSATPGEAFDVAMRLSTEHEARFRSARPNAFHLPRAQLSFLNDLHANPDVVLLPAGVRTLFGPEPVATLEAAGHAAVAAAYRGWYEAGWRCELDGWRDGLLMRACVAHGHAVLAGSLAAARSL